MHPSRYDYDDCIRVCREHKDELTAESILALVLVAGSWAAKVPVTHNQLATARAIVSRMDAKKLNHVPSPVSSARNTLREDGA